MPKKLKWISHGDLSISIKPTVRREEYLDYMTFRQEGKPQFTELFGPMVGLKEEWEEQGATTQELDFSAFPYRTAGKGFVAAATGPFGGPAPVTIEENDECIITRDTLGRTMKLVKGIATLPLPLDHPVRTMDDWLKIKPLYRFSEARFGKDWEAAARSMGAEGLVVCACIAGGFDEPRQLMGEEALCVAYYDQPELIHDMLTTMSDTAWRVLDHVSKSVRIDVLSVHEDMAGKSGPLAGPAQVREFIKPYYRRVWDLLAERGARLFEMDSDGDMNAVIPAFLEAGVNLMYPMEPGANMDIVKVRQQYGRQLALCGGIDKHVLRRSKAEIVRELEYKVPPMVKTGGCVIALDHRVPNGTPLENYRLYVSKVWEIMERETT